MKLTDYLAKFLKFNGVSRVFGLQGGAVVHIFDSFEKFKFDCVYTHHEQTASLAAVASFKTSEKLAVVVVTSGPGGTNSITGLLASWQDSIPCIFISGQVRTAHTSYGKNIRQLGTQESKIIDIVKPITKYSKFVYDLNSFPHDLDEAYSIAISGRPGPVWLDIPLDLQWQSLNINKIKKIYKKNSKFHNNKTEFINLIHKFNNSQKPLIVLGYGIQLSGFKDKYINEILNKKHSIVSTWTASDYIPTNNKHNFGIIGMRGQRGANKVLFESDFILCLGTHLSIPHTTTLVDDFAPKSTKAIVNLDKDQLNNLNIKFDIKIHCSLENFFKYFKKLKSRGSFSLNYKKMNWYNQDSKRVNSNTFIRMLSQSKSSGNTCYIIDGGGTALYSGFQSVLFKKRDKVVCSSSISSMGTGLAETIGSFKGGNFKKYVCIIGDGSFLMNVQDLQTIASLNIPALIVVVNNNGYLAIRQTQEGFLNNKYYGTHPKWSLELPQIKKIAKAFNFEYFILKKPSDLFLIEKIKKQNNRTIVELLIDDDQGELFRQKYSSQNGLFKPHSLDEMWPF